LITRIIFGDQYRSLSSPLFSLLHSPVTPSLLDPNIPLSTLFSNTLSLCCCLSVTDLWQKPAAFKDQRLWQLRAHFRLVLHTSD
jgi:hypothetical protein